MSIEEIGLNALKKSLDVTGMLRFLEQFDHENYLTWAEPKKYYILDGSQNETISCTACYNAIHELTLN